MSIPVQYKIVQVLAPKFFWREKPHKLLDLIFKIQPVTDRAAKFRGDQRRSLEIPCRKISKNICSKT